MVRPLNRIIKILLIFILILTSIQLNNICVNADTLPVNIQSQLEASIMPPSGDAMVVRLKWSENSVSKRGYYVQRKTDNEDYPQATSAYNIGYSAPASNAVNPSVTYTTYITGDTTGHKYTFRIIAIDTAGNPYVCTSEAAFTFKDVAIPASLDLTQVSSSQIDLAWTYPNSGSFDTIIERKRDATDANWEVAGQVTKNTFKFSDKNLTGNTKYFYRIRAVSNGNIFSQRYPQDGGDNPAGKQALTMIPAPTELFGFAGEANTIKLSWTNNYSGIQVIIERKRNEEQSFTYLATLVSDIGAYTDSSQIVANNAYTYRIRANDAAKGNYSEYSSEITVMNTYIPEPTSLNTVTNNDSNVELSWVDNSSSESGFEIWRKTGASGAWENYDSVGSKITEFIDRKTEKDKLYFYKVRAIIAHTGAYSAFSGVAKTYASIIQPPSELTAVYGITGDIKLSWKDNANSETGFSIERKTELEESWITIINSLPENTTSFVDTGVLNNKKYYYRIKVYDNSYINSYAYSEIVLASITVPTPPTGLTAVVATGNNVLLKWSDTSTIETGYKVEKRLDKGAYYQTALLPANSTSYIDDTVSQNSKYYYRIRAINNNNNSDYSNEVAVTTSSAVRFRDLNGEVKEAAENLASMGVFSTSEGLNFYPDAKVTRGEFTSFLVKAFKLKAISVGSYKDVKANHKYYKEIMIANHLGVVVQVKGNYFYPDGIIKREEIVVLLVKALKAAGKPLPSYDNDILNAFADKDIISSWALGSFSSVVGDGIIRGSVVNGQQLILPSGQGTRSEAALFIYRAIKNMT